MKISIQFDARDDLSTEHRDRIEGLILTTDEAATVRWSHTFNLVNLRYTTKSCASDVIEAWEDDGFNIDEFVSFKFSR